MGTSSEYGLASLFFNGSPGLGKSAYRGNGSYTKRDFQTFRSSNLDVFLFECYIKYYNLVNSADEWV